jgi:2-phosphosulfolactate phosphatase
MLINAYLTSNFKEDENQFAKSIVVYVDALRASTTIAAAIHNGAKEIIPAEEADQAMKIYASLDRSIRIIGGEKNMMKPDSFDFGNSPLEYTREKIEGKTIIFTTTNGTRIFTKAKSSKHRIIAAYVNFDKVMEYIQHSLSTNSEIDNISFLCAGNNGLFSFEDTLCIGGYISELTKSGRFELQDAACAAKDLFDYHKENIFDFLKSRDHCKKMYAAGLAEDIEESFSWNKYPSLPIIEGISIKTSII